MFTVTHVHLYTILIMYVLGKMLCRIDAAVLSAGASKREHKVGKASVYVTLNVGIGKLVHAVKKCQYLAVILKESDNGLVKSRQFLVWFVTARVMGRTTIEHISSSITRLVGRDALSVRETKHTYTQRTLAVIL